MKILRLLGASITIVCFMLSLVQAQLPQTSKNADANSRPYLLGPGDLLEVIVYGPTDINKTFQVDGDGSLNLPFIEPLYVKCRSENRDTQS